MNEQDALSMIRGFMSEGLGIDAEEVVPGAHLRDDLGLDSLDAISLIEQVQDECGVRFDPDDINTLATVGDLIRIVQEMSVRENKP